MLLVFILLSLLWHIIWCLALFLFSFQNKPSAFKKHLYPARFVTFVTDEKPKKKISVKPVVEIQKQFLAEKKEEQKQVPIASSKPKLTPEQQGGMPAKLTAPISRQAQAEPVDPLKDAEVAGKKTGKDLLAALRHKPALKEQKAQEGADEGADEKSNEKENALEPQGIENQIIKQEEIVAVSQQQPSKEDRIQAIIDRQEAVDQWQAGGTVSSNAGYNQQVSSAKEAAQDATSLRSSIMGRGSSGSCSGRRRGAVKSKNIIALTRGFVEKLTGEHGTDPIDRDGDPTKQPSLEEIKALAYEAKINWHLQQAWKQNFAYRPWRQQMEGDAVIEFVIDQSGQVVQSELLQSTGFAELDQMIMKNIKCACPFPPLPKNVSDSTYTTGRRIMVRASNIEY